MPLQLILKMNVGKRTPTMTFPDDSSISTCMTNVEGERVTNKNSAQSRFSGLILPHLIVSVLVFWIIFNPIIHPDNLISFISLKYCSAFLTDHASLPYIRTIHLPLRRQSSSATNKFHKYKCCRPYHTQLLV